MSAWPVRAIKDGTSAYIQQSRSFARSSIMMSSVATIVAISAISATIYMAVQMNIDNRLLVVEREGKTGPRGPRGLPGDSVTDNDTCSQDMCDLISGDIDEIMETLSNDTFCPQNTCTFLTMIISDITNILNMTDVSNNTLYSISTDLSEIHELLSNGTFAMRPVPREDIESGSANHVVINDGSGDLSSEAQLATSRGGTGVNLSAATGVVTVSSGTVSTKTNPSGAFLGTTDSQTLTNKVITDATNTVAANSLKSATGVVSTAAATAPSSGQVLTATSSTVATWQTPSVDRADVSTGTPDHVVINDGSGELTSEAQLATSRGGTGVSLAASTGVVTVSSGTVSTKTNPSGAFVGTTDSQTLTNKVITDSTNTVASNSVKSATTTINLDAATAPSSGQVLTATSSTAATWQTPTVARANVAAGTINHVVINDGSGLLSSEAQLATSRGGTGVSLAAATGVVIVSSGTVSATKATPSGDFLGTTDSQTLTNKVITDTSNTVAANSLKSATGVVSVAAATAPSVGQILTATGATTATWQDASGGFNGYSMSTSNFQIQDVTSVNTGITYTTTQLGLDTAKLTLIIRHGLTSTKNDEVPTAATIIAALPVGERVVGNIRRMYIFNTDASGSGSKFEWKEGAGTWPASVDLRNNDAFALSNGMGCELLFYINNVGAGTESVHIYALTTGK